MLDLVMLLDADPHRTAEDEQFIDTLLLAAAEPFSRRLCSNIGPETLSIARLGRETAALGLGDDDNRNIYRAYRFRLEDLPRVVAALQVPLGVKLPDERGGYIFSGEEVVLLSLRRFASPDTLNDLTWETGRSESAISAAVSWFVHHVHTTFPHLIDERSLTDWEDHFEDFADALSDPDGLDLPLDNLLGWIDGKLWATTRPSIGQQHLFSGHKRMHGVKTQGITLANGESSAMLCPEVHMWSPHSCSFSNHNFVWLAHVVIVHRDPAVPLCASTRPTPRCARAAGIWGGGYYARSITPKLPPRQCLPLIVTFVCLA